MTEAGQSLFVIKGWENLDNSPYDGSWSVSIHYQGAGENTVIVAILSSLVVL